MSKPSEFKKWVFVITAIGFILLFLISGVGMGYELITGGEIWWWLPLGWAGIAVWVVHMYIRPEIVAYLEEKEDE